jgi:predicted  nucleic acid-binding Zn-ribbon protein
MNARSVLQMSSGLPPRGSFSAQMAFMDDSRVPELPLSDDDDNSNAFEYLPDDCCISTARVPAPTPSPPPPPPPSPPVLPFRNTQRVRIKSVNLPSEVNASKTQSTRRATTSEAAVSGFRARSTSILGSRVVPSQSKVSEPRARGSVAASILCPDAATGTTHQEQEREVEPTPHTASSSSLIPELSVHPIDTLSKKLRQQAEELTRVYEQLATQREQLASYKSEAQAQKLEIERLKLSLKHQRDERSSTTTSSRRTVASSASTSGTKLSSGGGNVSKTALTRKVKEAEQEKQRYATTAKQLETVVADVQRYFHERRRTNSENDDSEDPTALATLEDQRMYIRVLEEVVHLKANEFQVSSHEELLVVLAELRHTIYEQEKEMEQQSQRVHDAEARLLEEKQLHLQVREQLDHQRHECADMSLSARAHESEMRQQILNVQRELQQHRDQLQQEIATCNQLRERERDLEKRLARESGELEATRTRLEHSVSSCDEISDKLSQATAKADDATRQAKYWEVEATRRQTHLDEMNALQEELLDSIAEASGSQERTSERAKQLEQELRECEQRERETATKLDALMGRTDCERRQLKQRLDELKLLNEQMDAQCSSLREQTQALDESLESTQRQLQEHVERADEVQRQLGMREKEIAQHREAAAQVEAALGATLQVIATSGANSVSINSYKASGDKSSSGGVNGSDGSSDDIIMDATAIEAVRVCCTALDSLLPSDDEAASPWSDVMVPSLTELLVRLMLSGTRLVSEMEQSRESWARERRNLREACFALEEVNHICQLEVDQRHRELLDCQRALADVSVLRACGFIELLDPKMYACAL